MWIPAIVATIVTLTTIIVMTILEKRGKLEQGARLYKLLEVVGIIIPMFIIAGNYAFMKTDTLIENIIVMSGIFSCLGLVGLLNKKGIISKYIYIFFPIIILVCFFICNYITTYMLSDFPSGLFAGVIGSVTGTLISKTKKKKRLIISSIIIFFIIVTAPTNFLKNFETRNKVERVTIEYVESLGYDVTDRDVISPFSSSRRNEKISLFMFQRKMEDQWKPTRCFKLVYFNGEIIEFKKEI